MEGSQFGWTKDVLCCNCVVCESSIQVYWNGGKIMRTYPKSIGMSRDKFMAILTMLHLNNIDTWVHTRQTMRTWPGIKQEQFWTTRSWNLEKYTHQKNHSQLTELYVYFRVTLSSGSEREAPQISKVTLCWIK